MSDVGTDYFTGSVSKDFFRLFCGDRIGFGSARETYECLTNPAWVVKIEFKAQSFQNIFEWDIWLWVKEHGMKRYFAPCRFISPCGAVLIQDRTAPLPLNYELPKKMPAMMGDLKRSNFGLLNGKLVAHDYGTNNVTMQLNRRVRLASSALVKANWVPD